MRLLWKYRLEIVMVLLSDMALCYIMVSLLDVVLRESVIMSISDMFVCMSRLNVAQCRWCFNI
jgi:hypothetical protein